MLKETYDKQWKYPFDWSEKKEQEIEKVKILMDVVEGENKEVEEVIVFEQK